MSAFSRRRGLGLVVVAALALLIGRAFNERPAGVDVVYRFGAGAAQIQAMDAVYHAGHVAEPASAEGRLSWRFGPGGAPAEKTHAARLRSGEHTVELTVIGPAGVRRTSEAHIEVGGWSRSRVFIDVPDSPGTAPEPRPARTASPDGAAER